MTLPGTAQGGALRRLREVEIGGQRAFSSRRSVRSDAGARGM